MAGPETPELAEAAVDGGRRPARDRLPVLRPARGRPGHPPGRRARARAGDAHAALPRVPRRDARARVDVPLIPMTYASILEAYGYERFCADARRRGRDEPDRRRPARSRLRPSSGACSSSRRRLRPSAIAARRRANRRLALPRLAHRHDGRARRPSRLSSPASSSARGRVTDVPLLAGFGISTPEQAAEAAALADGIVVGSRAVEIGARGGGPAALRELRRVAPRGARRGRPRGRLGYGPCTRSS